MSGYRKLTINLPNPLVDLHSKWLHLEKWRLRTEGLLPVSEKAMYLECWESLHANRIIELEPLHAQFLAEMNDDLTRNRWLSLERDNFRCLLCGSTGTNRGGSRSHHIIPRSYKGWRPIPLHDIRNLATLDERCHEAVTDPQAPHMHWRQVALRLWAKLGEKDLLELWESRGE
jgi:hypothetical protein